MQLEHWLLICFIRECSLLCQFKIPAPNSHNLLFTFVMDTVRKRSGIATGKALIIEPFN
jgi:hypothetical protein